MKVRCNAIDGMSGRRRDVVRIAYVIRATVATAPTMNAYQRYRKTGAQCVRKPQATKATKLARRASWRRMVIVDSCLSVLVVSGELLDDSLSSSPPHGQSGGTTWGHIYDRTYKQCMRFGGGKSKALGRSGSLQHIDHYEDKESGNINTVSYLCILHKQQLLDNLSCRSLSLLVKGIDCIANGYHLSLVPVVLVGSL